MLGYNLVSKKPSIARVTEQYLAERIDAEYYEVEHLENAEKFQINLAAVALSNRFDVTKLSGFEYTEHFTKSELENGTIPCVMSQNVGHGSLHLEKCVKISENTHHFLKRSKLNINDIVLSYTGQYRRAATVPGDIGQLHLGPNVCKLTPINSGIDSYFITTFLNCYHGQGFLDREKTISAQPTVNMERIRGLKIPDIQIMSQHYIGNKVRQAELLRNRSRLIELQSTEIFSKITDELGYIKRKPEKTGWTTLENRLDPVFYDKQYSFFKDEWFVENSKPLTNYIAEGSYGVLPASNSYGTGNCRFITAADIVEANYNSQVFINVPIEEVHKKAKISKDQILLEIKGGINYCVVASDILDGAYVNGSVFRFSVSGIGENYLAFYLNSKFKDLYCDRVSVNNIIKYLDQESIHALPVLRLNDDLENFLGSSYKKIQLLKRETFNLIQASQFLVESLIEGQITEAQLIEAQQALEAGDNSKDRAILSKLTGKGYLAEDGKPLFTDLDKLYELLEEAAVDANEESV